jgi:hypothetical protein
MNLQSAAKPIGLERILRPSAIAAAPSDILALLGCRANTAATTAEARAAALRLALVILKDEE